MKKAMTATFALSALFAASGKVHADVSYPWCLMGDTRGYECVFSSREQCAQDGRNRGFGSQCIQNPYYKPGAPTVPGENGTVSQTARPSQAVSGATTCTQLKSVCLGSPPDNFYCNRKWEQCMKIGFWKGVMIHRPAERR
jgi:hypothetical protein